jgi:hypothetical protein
MMLNALSRAMKLLLGRMYLKEAIAGLETGKKRPNQKSSINE